jgi:hypothetical protein
MSTKSISTPKVHHFYPIANLREERISSPPYGSPGALPEIGRTILSAGTAGYTFDATRAVPFRVDDILLEGQGRRILSNRHAPVYVGQTKVVNDAREFYNYDPVTRRMTFAKPLTQDVSMIWFDMTRSRVYNDQWHQHGNFSLKRLLVQGATYIDEALIPPGETRLTGKFQGGFRCYPEIVSQPKNGVVRMSDDLLGFAYRGRQGFSGLDSFEYLIYNGLGQVSDVYCFNIRVS